MLIRESNMSSLNSKLKNLNRVIDYNDLDNGTTISLTPRYDRVTIKNFPKNDGAILDIRGTIKELYIEDSYIKNLRVFRVLDRINISDSHIEFVNFISYNKEIKFKVKDSTIEVSQNKNLFNILSSCGTKHIANELDRITFRGYTYLFPLNKKICIYEHTHLKDITEEDYNDIREVLSPHIADII